MTDLSWHWFNFEALGVTRLYQLLQLRSEVFVVEQDCVYQDLDDRDQDALHLLGILDDQVHACARLLPPGLAYHGYAAIGRVITSQKLRGSGQGRPLMQQAIAKAEEVYPNMPLKLSGQQHLERYYNSLGFKAVGEPYLEDGIPHLAMIREPNKT